MVTGQHSVTGLDVVGHVVVESRYEHVTVPILYLLIPVMTVLVLLTRLERVMNKNANKNLVGCDTDSLH